MKKNLILFLLLVSPMIASAQATSDRITTAQMVNNPAYEKEFFSLMDMKILHDRQIMQDVLLQLAEQQMNPKTAVAGGRDKLTQGVFNERDSDILETKMDERRIQYNITPELLEKADKHPFEAFKDLIRSATIPRLTDKEMEELNRVDDQAIPQMLQMVTESGPDVGARPVSVFVQQ